MRSAFFVAALVAAVALTTVPSASAACLFGYDPNADANVCYEVDSYQEPAYVYTVEFTCTYQIGTQCVGAPYFEPLYQGGWYDVPFAHVWVDGVLVYCNVSINVVDVAWIDRAPRCPTHVSSQGATVLLFDELPL